MLAGKILNREIAVGTCVDQHSQLGGLEQQVLQAQVGQHAEGKRKEGQRQDVDTHVGLHVVLSQDVTAGDAVG